MTWLLFCTFSNVVINNTLIKYYKLYLRKFSANWLLYKNLDTCNWAVKSILSNYKDKVEILSRKLAISTKCFASNIRQLQYRNKSIILLSIS